jgi:uncharacterized radical SAM superfamily Fe-S cluster-containing enzyme
VSKEAEGVILSQTESLCPVCLKHIPANRVADGENVYLEKICDEHGAFRVIIWRGNEPSYLSWAATKPPSYPPICDMPVDKGCPFDCGLCPDHRQHTCCVLLEVTGRCNLQCPVCFAQAGEASGEVSLNEIGGWYKKLMDNGGPFNIQLSGGEPTLRDDLPEIIALGRSMGFSFIQVNTNGLRLAADWEYAQKLKEAGLSCVFLQFDGTNDSIYRKIRGKDLLDEKIWAIECCTELSLGVILVVTVVPGVNDKNIGEIIRFALERIPTVRGVHFQPISYFGRYPHAPSDEDRITIPEIIRAIESQTDGQINAASLRPPRAENSYCSFQGNYVLMPEGELKVLTQKEPQGCCGPAPASAGAQHSREFVAKKWAIPAASSCACKTDKNSSDLGINTASLDEFLDRAERYSFCLSGMAFQDVWTLDLDRLRECFIHVVAGDGRIIPFCAYNLTDGNGRALYRPQSAAPPV